MDPIKTSDVLKVDSVDHGCICTGQNIIYFHLATDKKSQLFDHGGCYRQWTLSRECFIPHSVRYVSKKELEKLSER
jgi:hypothetical protein